MSDPKPQLSEQLAEWGTTRTRAAIDTAIFRPWVKEAKAMEDRIAELRIAHASLVTRAEAAEAEVARLRALATIHQHHRNLTRPDSFSSDPDLPEIQQRILKVLYSAHPDRISMADIVDRAEKTWGDAIGAVAGAGLLDLATESLVHPDTPTDNPSFNGNVMFGLTHAGLAICLALRGQ